MTPMWICFNDAFISAVQDRRRPSRLVVRARKRKHLERLFPGKRIAATPDADYAYRVSISKKSFARKVVSRISAINYDNFKDSVSDAELHDLYLKFWSQHWQYQHGPDWLDPLNDRLARYDHPAQKSLRLETNVYGIDEWTR
jgi:hypothetical protein